MLTRISGRACGCCTDPNPPRVYQWFSYWYCLTCLHSIGRNAAGNFCTNKQYENAWRKLSE